MQSEMIIYTVATSAPKKPQTKNPTQPIKEEKIKTFHKLCFQTSLVQYEGPIPWFSPGQLKVVNQQNRMYRWHPGLLGCSSVHSIDTVKQKPAQETQSCATRIKAFTIFMSALHHYALMDWLPSVSEKCCLYSNYCTFTLLFTASLAGKLSHYIYI